MLQEQLILIKRSLNIYNTETEAWAALDNLTHTQGQPVVAFFRRTSNTHGDTALGAIFAIGTANGVGKYKACSSHDDMLAVAQSLNTHISEWTAFKDTFDKMFEYDANHNAIKAKLDFYTDSNKNISAGGLGGSGSSSLGALYQLVDVMINSTGDGVEGAVEGSVLAYDATAGKWKAISQSEILPDMSGYYTKDETNAAINAIPIYSIAKLSTSDIASLSDGANVREAYRLKKGGNNVDDTVIKIYKDSAIKSLEIKDNKYLILTYTDNEGNEKSISKDLSVIVNDNYVDVINNQEIGGIKTFIDKTIFKKDINVYGNAIIGGEVSGIVGDAEPAGVTDYAQLQNKPAINGKELVSGDNTLEALGIQPKGDYTTASQLATALEDYATKVYVSNNYASKSAVNTIQALIPATASADNQLADKAFVNSSIATATAEFRGSFTSLDELKATSGNLNDYAFYLHTDSVGNKVVDRYKWTTAGWLYEYTLNNSSFTAEQWAALNSAITATLVQSYNSHLINTTIHITATERDAWNNKWDYNEDTIKAVKVNAAVNADYASSAGNADKLDGYHKDDILRITKEPTSVISLNDVVTKGIDFTSWSYSVSANINNQPNGDGAASAASVVSFGAEYPFQIYSDYNNTSYLYYRSYYSGTGWKNWRRFAFIDSNVASATKLATARKIWGKYFDGSADVSGDLTEVGNITASGNATIQGDIVCGGEVAAIVGEGTPVGVTDYSALTGKPSINGVTLVSGNNTLASLGIQAAGDYATISGVTTLLANYADKTFVSNNYVGKSAFNNHTADTDIHITSAERTAWNAKWDYNEATIKAVKVNSASSADSVAWSGIKNKPSTFTPSAHTHTASEVSGLPTNLSAFTNDVGYITGITKSMVEGVLTGDITSHTHTFASLTSKPTTLSGYGITDNVAYRSHWNNFIHNDNEFTFASPAYSGAIWINYRTSSGAVDGAITEYRFNNGAGLYANLRAAKYIVNDGTSSQFLKGDGSLDSTAYLPLSGGTLTGPIIIKKAMTDEHWGAMTIKYNGSWSAHENYIAGINVEDSSGIVGRFGVTYDGNYGKFIVRGLYNSGYDKSGEVFSVNAVGDVTATKFIGSLSGNAASATKLATARTIWGQSFDGSGNVNGVLSITTTDEPNTGVGAEINFYLGGRGQLAMIKAVYESVDWSSINPAAGSLRFYTAENASPTEKMRILPNGNILIGTTTDNGYKLQVNGSERVYGDLIVDGEVSALVA